MRRLSSRTIIITAIAVVLLVLQLLALLPNTFTPLAQSELASRDLMMRLRPAPPRTDQIAIVAIDDASFNWTGYHWPWPRAYLAKIVNQLNQDGASVIGLDVLLLQPDADPQGDKALAAAFAQSKASVGLQNIFRTQQVAQGVALDSVTIQMPLEAYQQSFTQIGISPVVLDPDAVLRDVLAYDQVGSNTYTHWAFEVAGLYRNAPLRSDAASAAVTFNGQGVPLSGGRLLVNFSGPAGTYPTYSAYSVAEGDVPPDAFKGKIVLIGATSPAMQDLWATPYSASDRTPGVEVVANAVNTILSGRYLYPAAPWMQLLETVFMALVAALILRLREPVRIFLALAVVMAALFVGAFWLLNSRGIEVALIAPAIMLGAGVVLPTMGQAVSQELEKRRLRGLFGRFLSGEIIDQMVAAHDLTVLNKRADITVLFSDIRDFTTLSEKLPPEKVVGVLNPYLEAMARIIYRYGGTIDKYEGDAIMAFFGEPVAQPDHALRAIRTAVDMHLALQGLRERWYSQGILPPETTFQIGIGLNSGPAFVGLLGSEHRINYTAIGDNVNLASRLQDLTKRFEWPILVSSATYELVKDEFETEFVDSVLVKGKSEPVGVYKVLGRKGASKKDRIQAMAPQGDEELENAEAGHEM